MLFDLGYLSFTEPFTALLNQGMVILDGSKMSKSKGNIVYFTEEVEKHGVDAVRLTMAFAGPPEDDIDWNDVSPGRLVEVPRPRLARREGRLVAPDVLWKNGDPALRRVTHRFLADAPGLVESFKFNVVVARLMELVNATRKAIDSGAGPADAAVREAAEVTAMALNLFAPYTAEDMWEKLGYQPGIALVQWRKADPTLLDRGVRHRRRAGRRQGARQARRCRRRSRQTSSRRSLAPRPASCARSATARS